MLCAELRGQPRNVGVQAIWMMWQRHRFAAEWVTVWRLRSASGSRLSRSLPYNKIGGKGCSKLAEALAVNTSLQILTCARRRCARANASVCRRAAASGRHGDVLTGIGNGCACAMRCDRFRSPS